MKVYEYAGNGKTLGAKIVVIAKNKRDADRQMLAMVRANELDPTTFELCGKPEPLTGKPQVVYFWDGEY